MGGTGYKLLRSYLDSRSQSVQWCDGQSDLYADDASFLVENPQTETTKAAIKNWWDANRLKLNLSKTESLTFSTGSTVASAQFLGLQVDTQLKRGMVMKGWFDAFRNDGGPTLYNFNNRTAVTGDITLITFLTIFSTLYVAFLIIFPGIRKERFTTFFTVTLSLFVGATILVSIFGSDWHVGSQSIVSSYKAFSKEKVQANLNVYVGLQHVNITLRAHNWTTDVDFNERFYWYSSAQMGNSFREALSRGLPYPILTVAEYFNTGQEGLSWGGQYRTAGYFAIIMLWTSFALWLLMNLMLIVVPRYGAMLMTTCGLLLLGTVCGYLGLLPENPLVIHIESSTINFHLGWCYCGYLGLLPENPLVIHIESSTINFHLGWCYWLVFAAGCICLLSGVIITTVEIVFPNIFPNSFSTILEVDYDTPYDRHIIIEDSHGKRYQKKRFSNGKLEEPSGISLGSRILRRLSSKTREEKSTPGAQNFELEQPPKTPWKYPFKHAHFSSPTVLPRTASQDSFSSVNSKDLPPVHKDISRLRTHPENIQEVSMW
ncbi:Dual oxidase maturation factor [Popillia japonica]|uniref:Dual oxidase maturation factor n=1 Tax=Popillia japonica TaxID=7064 RepID=A0AAW1LGT3_POPJA